MGSMFRTFDVRSVRAWTGGWKTVHLVQFYSSIDRKLTWSACFVLRLPDLRSRGKLVHASHHFSQIVAHCLIF